MKCNCLGALALICLAMARSFAANNPAADIENDVLRVALATDDASLTVTDKRAGLIWRQPIKTGF